MSALLNFTRIRVIISFVRAFWFIKILRKLSIIDNTSTSEVHEHTVFSNLRRVVANKQKPLLDGDYLFGLDKHHEGTKIRTLMNPVISIDRISDNLKRIKVLIIGPKLEAEILSVMSYGIPLSNIKAVDLISYSPWIEKGDMHNLSYQDDEFDLILCGWVIAYSNDKAKAASEIIRVGKKEAIIALGATDSPLSNEEVIARRGYLVGSEQRINNVETLLSLFKEKIAKIYFKHDVDEDRKNTNGKILTVFSLNS
jgi:hypothetical protein